MKVLLFIVVLLALGFVLALLRAWLKMADLQASEQERDDRDE